MLVFLNINHVACAYEDDELIQTILSVAAGTLDYEGLLAWLRCHVN